MLTERELRFEVATRILSRPTTVDTETAIGAADRMIEIARSNPQNGPNVIERITVAASRVFAARNYSNTDENVTAAVEAVTNVWNKL